jgi:predicted translin family RNA/ssDNA-binding protein
VKNKFFKNLKSKNKESKMNDQRPPRSDEFLREIPRPAVRVPTNDFGMYQQMCIAFSDLHEYLNGLRSRYGQVGYSGQNLMSDLSKAYIEAIQRGDEEEAARIQASIHQLSDGFDNAVREGALPESPDNFSRTMWQEHMEAELFGRIWPVIAGKSDAVPPLTSWKDFPGNVQAFLYGYLDVVSELGKAIADELSGDVTTEHEFQVFQRFLAIADSITLRLAQERHVPGYVINNGYGRWLAYSNKLRTAYGTIAHVRRDYNLRRSIQRMIRSAVQK